MPWFSTKAMQAQSLWNRVADEVQKLQHQHYLTYWHFEPFSSTLFNMISGRGYSPPIQKPGFYLRNLESVLSEISQRRFLGRVRIPALLRTSENDVEFEEAFLTQRAAMIDNMPRWFIAAIPRTPGNFRPIVVCDLGWKLTVRQPDDVNAEPLAPTACSAARATLEFGAPYQPMHVLVPFNIGQLDLIWPPGKVVDVSRMDRQT